MRTLENQCADFSKKLVECESSCQGISNLFDETDSQIKSNTRNILHHNTRLDHIEECLNIENVVGKDSFVINKDNEINLLSQRIAVLEKQLVQCNRLAKSSTISSSSQGVDCEKFRNWRMQYWTSNVAP